MAAPLTPLKAEIVEIAAGGLVFDQPGHILPPGAWTDGLNVRFENNKASRFPGDLQVFGSPIGTPYKLMNVPGLAGESFWIYFDLDKASVWDGAVHTDITRTVGGAYTAGFGRDWCTTLLAGIPVITNFSDIPQYWTGLGAGFKLENLPNWDATKKCKRIIALGSYLFALNLIEGGTAHPHKVLVSHKADPGSVPSSWDPSDSTVDAVEFELTDAEGGEIQDALPLSDMLIVYKNNSAHTIRFQGGTELWKRDLLFVNRGILGPSCVAAFKEGTMHFVATQDDLIVHSGTPGSSTSIVEGTNRKRIFDNLDIENAINSFVYAHPIRPELWFCYVESGNTYPNMRCIYNYVDKTATFTEFSGLGIDQGLVAAAPAGDWDSDSATWDSDLDSWDGAVRQQIIVSDPLLLKLQQLESGFTFNGFTFMAFLERQQLVWEGKYVKFGTRVLVDRLWPKITGTGKWNIRVGGQENLKDSITWSLPALFDPALGANFVDIDPPINTRLLSVRFENTEAAESVLQGYDLRMTPVSEH